LTAVVDPTRAGSASVGVHCIPTNKISMLIVDLGREVSPACTLPLPNGSV
jgi:hypothetical protein